MADIRDATVADADQVYELLDARSRAAFGISEMSRDLVAADFRRVAADRWVAVAGGDVVGYAHLLPTHDAVLATVHADLADRLLLVVEERAHARNFEEIVVTVVPEDEPLYALVRRSGFVHERDVLRMWRTLDGNLPQARWPSGVTVRGYVDADGERVHALLDAAYGAWDTAYVEQPHDEWLALMTDHDDFDPAMWFLVERGDELVACALHWKEHQRRGWVKDLVVRESDRGRGLATALLHEGFSAYAARGVERVGLKADSTNPTGAPRLYERVGFATDRSYGIWVKRP